MDYDNRRYINEHDGESEKITKYSSSKSNSRILKLWLILRYLKLKTK
jgi:hypothetical protein